MKKTKFLTVLGALVVFSSLNLSANALGGYDPGIYKKTNNDSKTMQYNEITFVTGKPVLLTGTLTRTVIDKEKEYSILQRELDKVLKQLSKNAKTATKNNKGAQSTVAPVPTAQLDPEVNYNGTTISEKYSLSGEGVKITRDLSITPVNKYYAGQIIQTANIKKAKETINVNGKTYKLDSNLSEMSESVVIDTKPAIDYYGGNASFYKVFTEGTGNKEGAAKLIIQMDGKSTGYDEFWGKTDTKTLNYTINLIPATGGTDTKTTTTNTANGKTTTNTTTTTSQASGTLNGTYTVKVSQNSIKDLIYSENDPKKISFRGGYGVTSQNNAAMEYTYDINGVQGSGNSQMENMPEVTRLFAPVLTDVQGHYAQEAIKIVTSMNGFDSNKKMFLPNAYISRDEFARAVVVTSGLYNNKTDGSKNKKTTYRLKEELFSDMKVLDENYNYVKTAVEKKIMIGRDDNKFEPKNPITKVEAIAILTNSLGLDVLIPNGKFSTGFEDESQIPPWAYDSVYIAQNIGLIEKGGTLLPNSYLTKADASEMLLRYVEYMTGDLKEDYMQRILNY